MSAKNRSLLEKIYYGAYCPNEDVASHDPQYDLTNHQVGIEEEHLCKQLSPDDKKRFDRLMQLVSSVNNMEGFANFAYGFRSGMLLMQELFAQDEKNAKT